LFLAESLTASIASVSVAGDGTYGTSCQVYSDENCNNQIADSGNAIAGIGVCTAVGYKQAKSMKCWFKCKH
jgi:hypothetical protein